MWYDLLVGRLLYTSPLILSTDYDLHYIAMVRERKQKYVLLLFSFFRIVLSSIVNTKALNLHILIPF